MKRGPLQTFQIGVPEALKLHLGSSSERQKILGKATDGETLSTRKFVVALDSHTQLRNAFFNVHLSQTNSNLGAVAHLGNAAGDGTN